MSENPETFTNYYEDHGLNPQYGLNIPGDYVPKYFNKEPVFRALENLHEKIKNKQVLEACRSLPQFDLSYLDQGLDSYQKWRDSLYLQGLLTDLLHAFINEKREEGKKDFQIVVPYNLGYSILLLTKAMNVKQGMAGEFYFNWKLKNNKKHTDQLQVPDLDRLFHFTPQEFWEDENMFFGCSFIGSEYLFRSIKLLREIKEKLETDPLDTQELCARNLGQVKKNIQHINRCNYYLSTHIKPTFVSSLLRKFIVGFKNVSIENCDQKLTSEGGAGGFDPSFQIVQRFLGIKFTGQLAKAQGVFRAAFSTPIKNFIDELGQYSIIRDYCEIVPAMKRHYNQVVKQYSYFYVVHRILITKFGMPTNPQAPKFGTADIDLKSILDRSTVIASFCL